MSPYLIELGNFRIKWYSIFILIGIIISAIFIIKEGKKFNITKDFLINLIFWTIFFGIIGARLYFVAFSWDYYSNNLSEIYKVWEGGLAIHGGLIFGIATIIIYCKKYKISPWRILDIVAPCLLLSQAIGRWGNFFNQEAYGPVTTLESLQNLYIPKFVINGMFINGEYHLPTFFFESIWCLLGFIVIMIIRRYKYLKIGQQIGTYFIWYSAFRFFIEYYRQDSLKFYGFRVAQIVSIALFLIGVVVVSVQSKKPKLEELYNDDKNIEVLRF